MLRKLLAADVRGLKAVVVTFGLLLALGTGNALDVNTPSIVKNEAGNITVKTGGTGTTLADTEYEEINVTGGGHLETSGNITIDEGGSVTLGGGSNSKTGRIQTWIGDVQGASPSHVTVSGGDLTVGQANSDSGGNLETNIFSVTGGSVKIQGNGLGGSDWANQNSFVTGGFHNGGTVISLTGGDVTLDAYGRLQTTRTTFGGSQQTFLIDGSTVTMEGAQGSESVIRAASSVRQTNAADMGSNSGGYSYGTHNQLVMNSGALSVNGHGVILSRETHLNGGTVTVGADGKLTVAGVAEHDGADVLTGVANSGANFKQWGDFTISGAKIENSGIINFITKGMTLNASGGELSGNLSLIDTAGSTKSTTYSTNLQVLKGGTFKIGGNLEIDSTATKFENLGTLEIVGTTTADNLLTLGAGSSTTFGGAVTATGGINVGSGSAATFNGTSNTLNALTAADDSTVTIAGTAATATSTTLGKNSTLNIAETSSLTAGALALQDSTKLKVAVNANDVTKYGKLNATSVKVGDKTDTDTINAYLKTQNTSNLISKTTFSLNGTALKIDVAEQTNVAQGMEDALTSAGIGEMASGINASATGSLADILKGNATDYAAGDLSDEGMAVYGLMDAVFGNDNGSLNLSTAESRAVVNALAGYDSAKSLDIAMVTTTNVNARVNARVADNNLSRANADSQFGSGSALASYALNNSFANRFWVGGFGLWEDADKRGWDSGYEYKSGGFITGYDRVFGAVTVGGSFAYTAGSYEDKAALASDSSIDSYAFTLYGTYNHCSGFFATLMGGYTYSDYDMNNLLVVGNNTWNKADFHANTWTIGGTLGYDFRPTDCLTITPTIGLYHYTSATNTFANGIGNNLKVEQDATELPIDVAVNYDIPTASGKVRLSANAGYAYSFSKDGGELSSFGYNGIDGSRIDGIKGRENARSTWNLGAGATYYAGRFDVGVKYDYYAKSDYDAHRIMGTVGISF